MMKSVQRGEGMLKFLLTMVLMFGAISWLLSDFLPAQADDLQAVVSLAERSSEAQSSLATSLKATPNPNRGELLRMRKRVNEIIVTETARTVTGDSTLETPSEREAAIERQAAARLAAIESKTWSDMSNQERAELFLSRWYMVFVLLAFLGIFLIGLRAFSQRERGY